MQAKLRVLILPPAIALCAITAVTAQPARNRAAAASPPQQCVDPALPKPVDCVPTTFDTFDIPFDKLPGGRMDANGNLDKKSSPEDAHKGAFVAAQRLGLFRNFEWVHWVPTAPSKRDPETGEWSGGDLDGFPTGWGSTGLGIAGDCLYWGRSNSTNTTGPGVTRDVKIFKIQANAERDPPVEVGEMKQLTVDDGKTAVRDRELRPYLYKDSAGRDRMLMVRSAATGTGGDVTTYTIDPRTCLPTGEGVTAKGVLAHEFFLWHDPDNSNRFLVISQTYGSQEEDLVFTAITDEKTGAVLEEPLLVASFTLENIGGPVRDEVPDATGLFPDGRFTDYSHLTDQWGRPGASQRSEGNDEHSGSLSDDGERFYAAGGTAGMYILDTEFVANHTNAELASGRLCNQASTNVWTDGKIGGVVDVKKLPRVAQDCVHPVLNSDPGVLAMLASSELSDVEKLVRYTKLEQRSRADFWPPFVAVVGTHSAVPVPGRPSRTRGNTEGRPAYVVITEEWPFGPCPERGMRMLSVESEINPVMIGAHVMSDSLVENCIAQPKPPGATIRPMMHAHNPTVFKNLVFVNWLGNGVRAIDISNPFSPREVGHARPLPWGDVMTYPDFHDGLIYVGDNHSGLHVLKYTGPRADELPQTGVYSSNRTSPHR
ncbi:MAG TPA: hypothetical protein VFO94_06170 [Gammaproteobacteria bacterium]|nr:hypothetical protein [Gammaproteobacteria bacterium]